MSTYIVFRTFEHNKDSQNICNINFLQYNGNEEELIKLYKYAEIVEEHNSSYYLDICHEYCPDTTYKMDIDKFFSETSVNEILKLNDGSAYVRYYKHDGKFLCPIHAQINKNSKCCNYNCDYEDDTNTLSIRELSFIFCELFRGYDIKYIFE
jgi:hypothetical protein